MNRFVALDSWRGICACLVCVFHFKETAFGLEYPALINNVYLYVDFFFVLSGFVIAYNYQAKIRNGFGIIRFMFLRLGRVYPLHIFMLMLFIAFTAVGGGRELASSSNISVVTNIFLLHSLGIHNVNTWNEPSWSISAEFYTYSLFAVAIMVCTRLPLVSVVVTILISPLLLFALGAHNIDVTHDFGAIRGIYGFAVGVLCLNIYKRFSIIKNAPQYAMVGTMLESSAVIATVAFVQFAGHGLLTLLAPLIFALPVTIFARERGVISRILCRGPMVSIGSLSYSIYMTHFFVQHCIRDGGYLLDKLFDTQIFTYVHVDGKPMIVLGTVFWQGDLACVVMLVCVIAVSWLTHRFVEVPGQVWFRCMVTKYPKLIVSPAAQSQPAAAALVAD